MTLLAVAEDVKRKGLVSEIISRLDNADRFIRDVKAGKLAGGSSGGGGTGTGYQVHTSGYDELATAFSTSSTSYTDVTGLSVTIVTTDVCTIIAYMAGAIAEDNSAGGAPVTDFRLMIGGVAQTAGTQPTLSSANVQLPLSALFLRYSVPAGSIVVKAQMRIDDGSETAYCRGNLVVLAISETLVGGGGSGTGDVVGPASSVDNRVATFDGTTGKLIQDSGVLITDLALLASPPFTGTPTAPTAAAGTSTTQLATTAFVTGAIREKLTANRTYYVRTDGSDSNTGLVDSAAGAFLTIQKAIDTAASLDTSIYSITIDVGDGTYVATTTTLKNILGSGSVTIQGNSATPANVIIDGGFIKSTPGTSYTLRDFRIIKSASAATVAISASNYAFISIVNLIFGSGFLTAHMLCELHANIQLSGDYEIESGAQTHILARWLGTVRSAFSGTITVTGTPTFTVAFASADINAFIQIASNLITISGGATGKRYAVSGNAYINTNGGGEAYLPGSTLGSKSTGGQYDTFATDSRNAAQFDKTNTTLANITGQTATLLAGRTYRFRAIEYTTSNIASGIKFAIAGTATATAIIYESMVYQTGVLVAPGTSRATALATTVANVTAVTVATVIIEGTITVNAAGTLTVQFADNAGTNTSSVLVGSNFEVIDITP